MYTLFTPIILRPGVRMMWRLWLNTACIFMRPVQHENLFWLSVPSGKEQQCGTYDTEKLCRALRGKCLLFTKRIIPCLDVHGGRVVKGVNFVNLKDAGDPVEIAKAYDKAGADELVFLDITASSDARNTVVDLVRRVAEQVFIPFTVGGGIRTIDDFRAVLREGADKISVNSAAIDDPTLISRAAEKFGSQCVVVAIDAKQRLDGGWNIYKHGGRIDTGIDAVWWAKQVCSLGAGETAAYKHGLRRHEGRL